MRIIIIYRPISEHGRIVEEYAHELEKSHGVTPELLSIDTREGADMARLYDVVAYPTILALRNDGSFADMWSGEHLPLVNDIIAYTRQG